MIKKIHNKIFQSAVDAQTLISSWKEKGSTLIFTNGCFDLIHAGHISYLAEAKGLGDKLIVGLNADASVARLKGESRPIKDELNRSVILASMVMVDMVILFDTDTPLELIRELKPDILVKGGDWSIDSIVGSKEVLARGGEVKSLAFKEGHSSTAIIDKIKNHD